MNESRGEGGATRSGAGEHPRLRFRKRSAPSRPVITSATSESGISAVSCQTAKTLLICRCYKRFFSDQRCLVYQSKETSELKAGKKTNRML